MAKFVREPALSAIGGTVLTPVMATSDKRASDGEITPADHQSVVDDINQREERAFVCFSNSEVISSMIKRANKFLS
jgi:hypothetical protein